MIVEEHKLMPDVRSDMVFVPLHILFVLLTQRQIVGALRRGRSGRKQFC